MHVALLKCSCMPPRAACLTGPGSKDFCLLRRSHPPSSLRPRWSRPALLKCRARFYARSVTRAPELGHVWVDPAPAQTRDSSRFCRVRWVRLGRGRRHFNGDDAAPALRRRRAACGSANVQRASLVGAGAARARRQLVLVSPDHGWHSDARDFLPAPHHAARAIRDATAAFDPAVAEELDQARVQHVVLVGDDSRATGGPRPRAR